MTRRKRTGINTRLIKWIGDVPVVGKDGWSVPNWEYENRRVIALPGFAERIVRQSDAPGLSRSYKWDKHLPNYLLEVPEPDALLILASCPNEFRDVSDHPFPETVSHTPIMMYVDEKTGLRVMKPLDILRREVSRLDY